MFCGGVMENRIKISQNFIPTFPYHFLLFWGTELLKGFALI